MTTLNAVDGGLSGDGATMRRPTPLPRLKHLLRLQLAQNWDRYTSVISAVSS